MFGFLFKWKLVEKSYLEELELDSIRLNKFNHFSSVLAKDYSFIITPLQHSVTMNHYSSDLLLNVVRNNYVQHSEGKEKTIYDLQVQIQSMKFNQQALKQTIRELSKIVKE